MPYGYITTSNEWKKQLKNFNRGYNGRKTLDELYGTIDTAAQKGSSIATQDYTDAISQAYGSAFGQKAAIANSNLFTGYKDAAIADIDYGLAEAYDTYRQNYLTQKAKVDENAALAREQISTALGTEAENFKAYQDSYYGYLTDLYNRAYGLGKYEDVGGDETLSNMFASDPLWNRYLIPGADGENPTLLTSSELYETIFDPNTKVITAQGTDFYNQMMNQLGVEGGKYGFNEYLANANPELYEWSQRQNPYNYTEGGTNVATFKQFIGLDAKDTPYDVTTGYKAMSDEQYNKLSSEMSKRISNFETSADDSKGKKRKVDEPIELGDEMFKSLQSYAEQRGVSNSVNWDDYSTLLDYINDKLLISNDDYIDNSEQIWPELVKLKQTSKELGINTDKYDKLGFVQNNVRGKTAKEIRRQLLDLATDIYNKIHSDIDKAAGH